MTHSPVSGGGEGDGEEPLDIETPRHHHEAMLTLLHFGALFVVFVTALSVWRHDAWWVRMWDFPRAQILLLALLLFIGLLLQPQKGLPSKILLALLIASLMLQMWRIYPYTPLASTQSIRARSTDGINDWSLMISNVLMENRQSQPLLDLVHTRRPDLFFAVEVDSWWAEQLAPLRTNYPHVLELPLDNTYGLSLYSRLPLIEPKIRFLFEEDLPSIHTRAKLENGVLVHLHLLHPKPPFPTESLQTTERDAEILLVGREIGAHDHPTVVAGDLNDVAWSHTTRLFQRISGMLDPRIGRGLYSTFHAQVPFLRWPLDHVFHSHHFKLVSLERLPGIGSDHFPIFARLNLEPMAPLEQDAPEPEPGDEEKVLKKIDSVESIMEDPLDETLVPATPKATPLPVH